MTLLGKDRWAGIRAVTLAMLVLIVAVLGTLRYSAELAKINWWLVSLFCGFSFVVFVLYRWNSAPDRISGYDVSDLLMSNGRADLWKHMVLLFATISAWVIVQQAFAKTLSTEMLAIVLGIFVGKEAVGQIAVAVATRPAAGDQNVNLNMQPAKPTPADPPLKVAVVDMPKAVKRKR